MQMGISQLVWGQMGVPTKHGPRGLSLVWGDLGSEFGSGSEWIWGLEICCFGFWSVRNMM